MNPYYGTLKIDYCENYNDIYRNTYFLLDGELCTADVMEDGKDPNILLLRFFNLEPGDKYMHQISSWKEIIFLGQKDDLILSYLLETNNEKEIYYFIRYKELKDE